MMGKVIFEETYYEAKKMIRESAVYSSGKDFLVKELAAEINMAPEFLNQVISELAQEGYVSKRRARKVGLRLSTFLYKKCDFRPRDFLAMPLRKHTNEQLQLEPTHCWAVM